MGVWLSGLISFLQQQQLMETFLLLLELSLETYIYIFVPVRSPAHNSGGLPGKLVAIMTAKQTTSTRSRRGFNLSWPLYWVDRMSRTSESETAEKGNGPDRRGRMRLEIVN